MNSNNTPSTSTAPMPSRLPNVNGVKPQGQKRKYTLAPAVSAPPPRIKVSKPLPSMAMSLSHAQMKQDLESLRVEFDLKNNHCEELEEKNARLEKELRDSKSALSFKDTLIKDLEKKVLKKKCKDPKVEPMEAQLEDARRQLEEVQAVNERLVKEGQEKDEKIRELEARSQDQEMDTIEEDVIDDWNPEEVHGDVPEEPEELGEDLRRWSPIESEFAEEASTPRIQNHPMATVDQIHEIWAAIKKISKTADETRIQTLEQNVEGLQQKVPDAAAFDGLQEEMGIKDRKIARQEKEIESLKQEKRKTAEKMGGLMTEVELLRKENEGKGSSLLEQRIRLLEGELAASRAETQQVRNALNQMAEDNCAIIQKMNSRYTNLVMLSQGHVQNGAAGSTHNTQIDEAGTSK